ncbi:MAG: hypothetical protein WCQ21_35935, partial [Verrucomicrobiota bacterium]
SRRQPLSAGAITIHLSSYLMTDTETALAKLSAHAIWARDFAWARAWYSDLLCPLYSEGLFVPPLFAYELRSAAERGERRPGSHAAQRLQPEAWGNFLLWVYSATAGAMSPALAAKPEMRGVAATRLIRLFALSLMSRFDLSPLRRRGVFHPDWLLSLEVERLANGSSNDTPLDRLWQDLDKTVTNGSLRTFVPLAERLVLSTAAATELDPFVAKLLSSDDDLDGISEPHIHGTNPRADNPRKTLWPTGEFAKRDLGTLPTELARLAPSELVLIHRAIGKDLERGSPPNAAPAESANEQSGFRTWFLFKVIQGSLLQRFSQTSRNAAMEPLARVQVDILDDPEQHRLLDPPGPPVISWYRALAIEIFHQFAQLSLPFKWDTDFVIGYCNGDLYTASVLDKKWNCELASSRESAFSAMAERCPPAFRAGWKPVEPVHFDNAGYPPKMDFWLRIALGPRRQAAWRFPTALKVRADYNQGFRIELLRNRLWGMATASECENVDGLEIIGFDQAETKPAVAARFILRSALRLEWEKEVRVDVS